MSSPISSVLATLDGNLQSIASQVGRLRASLELDDEQLKRMLTDARRDAAKVRDLIRAERPDAQWKDRGALDSLIRDLEVAAEQKRIQERRNKLLDLASELDRGKVKHRVEARTATLNGLRLEAVKQLRKDADLAQQDKQLPGPPAREWLHWVCNLQEKEDAQSLETLRTDFPALEHFVGEMEESYWVAGEPGAAIASQPSAPPAPMAKAAAAETVAFPTPAPKPVAPSRVADQDKVPHIVRPQPPAPSPAPATAAAFHDTTAPSRAVAQSPRRSENKTGWQAAAVAVAREPEPEAPPTAPSKKRCDKCGTDYPVQFIVCPIHGSALRVVAETVAAPAARDKSAVATTAAVAMEPKPTAATKAARAPAPAPVTESPKQAKVEAPVVEKVSKPARTEIETIAVVDEASTDAADGELSGLAHWTAQARKLLANPAVLAGVGLLLFVVLVAGVILLISHQRPKPVAPKPVAVAQPTVAPLTEVNVAANQPAGATTTAPGTAANTKTTADQSKPPDQTADTKPTQPTTVLNLPSPSLNAKPRQEDTPEAPSIAGAMPNANTMGEIVKGIPVNVPTQKARVTSGVAQGQLMKQVPPQYPQQARQLRVEGAVVLQATISKDGSVKSVKVVSGHTLLTKAAVDAVKQWHYKPFTVDGQPVEADTQVKVNFTLGTP